MILHCVFITRAATTSDAALDDLFADLRALVATLDGARWIGAGPNRDFERLSPDVSDGFVVAFDDRAALAAYAEHPTHKALGARLLAHCDGGLDGLTVVDLTAADGDPPTSP